MSSIPIVSVDNKDSDISVFDEGHTDDVWSVGFNHDGTKIVGLYDKTIVIWDVMGRVFLELKDTEVVTSVAFNIGKDDPFPSTKIVSGSWDNTIGIWNVVTGKRMKKLTGHKNRVTSVGFNHDGTKIVSGSWDNTIRVWNVETGTAIGTLGIVNNRDIWGDLFNKKGHTHHVTSVGFNHDGTKIVSGSKDKTIRIWDVETGKCVLTFFNESHTGSVNSVSFNHDGTRIVSGSQGNKIRVWNAETGKLVLTLNGHVSNVSSVGFNHDGTKIVSGSGDKTIRVWNVDTGECILTLKGHTRFVTSVGFNHDGTKIVSGSGDETIRVWNVP